LSGWCCVTGGSVARFTVGPPGADLSFLVARDPGVADIGDTAVDIGS
jgi:hypothetical protein